MLRARGSRWAKNRNNEPARIETDATPPDWLEGDALDYWTANVGCLINSGILSEPEKPAFAMLCQRWGDWRESRRMCETRGRDVELLDNNGQVIGAKRAPWDVRERDQYAQYVQLCREFGMTPASRSGVTANVIITEAIDVDRIT